MKVAADMHEKVDPEGGASERGHDAWVREKVARGLEQSRDRAAMIPAERVLDDLST